MEYTVVSLSEGEDHLPTKLRLSASTLPKGQEISRRFLLFLHNLLLQILHSHYVSGVLAAAKNDPYYLITLPTGEGEEVRER